MLAFYSFEGTLDDWEKILVTFPDAEVFQTSAWIRFLAESHRATPVIAVLRDGDDVAGYFAGMAVRKFGVKILGAPFVGWTTDFMGMRLRDGVSRQAAVKALERFAFRELHCMHVEFADRQFGPDDLDGMDYRTHTSVSYLVDLKPDEDEIYQRFSGKSCRYSIRKATKEGVVVEQACDEAFAEEYYAQLKDVFAKQNLVPTYGPQRVHQLIRHLLPTGRLLLLRAKSSDGTCIGTGIFLGYKKIAYFWGNASWRQYQHFCPNEVMHWHAIRYWKRQGMETYDLCGGSDYKRKYGGVEVQRLVFGKSKYRWMGEARSLAYRLFKLRQSVLGYGKRSSFKEKMPARIEGSVHMKIRIVEHSKQWRDALAALNARLAAGGSDVSIPLPPDLNASPPSFHQGLKQTRYLALDEARAGSPAVRGSYALKFQEFWLGGELVSVADFMLPVSEGIVHLAYAPVAMRLLLDALQRQPYLYGLGMGGGHSAVARFLRAAGWQMFSVPFFFNVVHPYRFLRNIVHLRKRSLFHRLALNAAAYSGTGWAAARCWDLAHAPSSAAGDPLQAETVDDFGPWSDEVWDSARAHYGMCTVRDAATLRKMYPCEAIGFERIMFSHEGKPVGWALLLNSQLRDHSYFGDMRLGSIVDCLAEPRYAAPIVHRSRAALVRQGVDLVVSNQSHRAWCQAMKASGFMSGPSNFIFASSKALSRRMDEKQIQPGDIHVNRGDGDGPINLGTEHMRDER
jgi:hypothetical protein